MTCTCNSCDARETCPFYEKDAEECVYEILAETAKFLQKNS